MNSSRSLTGSELMRIYLADKQDERLKDPDNLKQLLTFILNNNEGDTISSSLDLEIIEFCLHGLEDDTPLDEDRITFLREKQALASKQKQQHERSLAVRRFGSMAAVLVLVIGLLFFGLGEEGRAGIFDLVERWIIEDQGEQVIMKTPNMTLKEIEYEEDHLPEKFSSNFQFLRAENRSSTHILIFYYIFCDNSQQEIYIRVKEYADSDAPISRELEINKDAYTIVDSDFAKLYYCSNKKENSISWIQNNKLFTVRGTTDFSNLEDIVSCYSHTLQ